MLRQGIRFGLSRIAKKSIGSFSVSAFSYWRAFCVRLFEPIQISSYSDSRGRLSLRVCGVFQADSNFNLFWRAFAERPYGYGGYSFLSVGANCVRPIKPFQISSFSAGACSRRKNKITDEGKASKTCL